MSRFLPSLLHLLLWNYILGCSDCLYFYLTGSEKLCLLEDLPNDTVVSGKHKVEVYDENLKTYHMDPNIRLSLIVKKDDAAPSITQMLSTEGEFSFTTHEWGDHNICFSVRAPQSGWFHSEKSKVHIQLFVGSDAVNTNTDNTNKPLNSQMRIANLWLSDVLKEFELIRLKEIAYQRLSGSISFNFTYWVILQVLVVAGTCYWQVNHLRRFFVAKKVM